MIDVFWVTNSSNFLGRPIHSWRLVSRLSCGWDSYQAISSTPSGCQFSTCPLQAWGNRSPPWIESGQSQSLHVWHLSVSLPTWSLLLTSLYGSVPVSSSYRTIPGERNDWNIPIVSVSMSQCLNVLMSQYLSVSVSSEFQCLSVYQMHKHLTGMCRGCHHSFLSLLAPSIVCCLSVAGNNFTCKANLQWGVTCHLFVFLTRARPARLHSGQTEVSDFDGEVVVVQKYIVWFKVPGRCKLVISQENWPVTCE